MIPANSTQSHTDWLWDKERGEVWSQGRITTDAITTDPSRHHPTRGTHGRTQVMSV
eukprot:CAMPEP_0179059658 /NCGR_PEP_ID=MMETSP0796-20121207/25466_1 /TAXON_ID=73915 /ORGANISM="Pyrodinium bahamense, Strain pbaha01" /LENGTH=55 /DNA_ID=CAMNT_0020756421 /DNA_START=130 /DNA_END=297 /DNA_ORIENTATION=-